MPAIPASRRTDIGRRDDRAHRHAGEICRLSPAAGRIDAPAIRSASHHDPGSARAAAPAPRRDNARRETARAEGDKSARQALLAANWRAAGDEEHHAAHQHHRAEGGDERVDFQSAMTSPLTDPTNAPARMPATTPAKIPALSIIPRADAARQRRGRSDRQIEPAADDDEASCRWRSPP